MLTQHFLFKKKKLQLFVLSVAALGGDPKELRAGGLEHPTGITSGLQSRAPVLVFIYLLPFMGLWHINFGIAL